MDGVFDLELDDGKIFKADSNENVVEEHEVYCSSNQDETMKILNLENKQIIEHQNGLDKKRVSVQDFKLLKILGEGGYGKVFQVRKINGSNAGTLFAMKVLCKAFIIKNPKDTAHTKAERSILKRVKHPFIVDLKYAFQSESKLYLVTEYLSGGELLMRLYHEKLLYENVACFYLCEIILAIEYLHSHGIVYRDLKPDNILLDTEGHIKIIDFGLSKENMEEGDFTYTFCGTIEYMAPEIIARSGYGKEVDWWSLGALMYGMTTGEPPFVAETREKIIANILTANLDLPSYLSSDAKDLICKLLNRQVSARLKSGIAIKQHQFFKHISWNDVINRRLKPPFKPSLSSDDDVSYFDSYFTKKMPVDSPVEGTLSKSDSLLFQDFSYMAPSFLETTGGPHIIVAGSPKKNITTMNHCISTIANSWKNEKPQISDYNLKRPQSSRLKDCVNETVPIDNIRHV